jgi:high-affinity Fe2+/Pb2+ permease
MIGGDIVRAGVAINGSAQPASIMVTSIVDRIVDSVALLVLTLIGFVWIGGRSATGEVVLWGGLALLLVGVGVLAIVVWLLRRTSNARLAGIRDASQVLVEQPGLIARPS